MIFNYKLIVSSVFVVSVVLLGMWWLTPANEQVTTAKKLTSEVATPSIVASSIVVSDTQAQRFVEPTLDPLSSVDDELVSTQGVSSAPLQLPPSWRSLRAGEALPYVPGDPDMRDYAYPIRVDTGLLRQVQPGATLTLPLPQLGRSIEGSVAYVEERDQGRRLVRGETEFGRPYSFVITLGRKTHYATVTTPSETYALQWRQDQGWILAGSDRQTNIQPFGDDAVSTN